MLFCGIDQAIELSHNWTQVGTEMLLERRTLKQLHLELRALGYEGSYDRGAAFARRWKVDQLERVNSASKSTQAIKFLPQCAIASNIPRSAAASFQK